MEMYVRVLMRSNIARLQERNINNAPKRGDLHIFSQTNAFYRHVNKNLYNIYYTVFINKMHLNLTNKV